MGRITGWNTTYDAATRRVIATERARFAAEIHDLAIQRLWASRLGLASVSETVEAPVREQLEGVASVLDDVVADLREQILCSGAEGSTLRRRLEDALVALLGPWDCDFDLDIDVEPPVGDDLAAHVRAVVVEAASNAVRHGSASMVWVALDRIGGSARLTVSDNGDGRGVPSLGEPPTPGNGIRNMTRRAEELGGACTVRSRTGGGTTVEWTVPIGGGAR